MPEIKTELGTSLMFNLQGPKAGPTLVVVGGHHGDKPAGYAAAGLLSVYARSLVGRLIIIPQASPVACATFNRFTTHAGESDLNRCYKLPAGHRDAKCAGALHANAIFETVIGC